MAPLGYIWKVFTNIVYTATLSPFLNYESPQQPIGNAPQKADNDVHIAAPPLFKPRGSNIDGFLCDYTKFMPEWESCQTPTNKSCWLRNKVTFEELTVWTDYEKVFLNGTTRKHTLVVEDGWWNADGMNFTEAKLINGTFPGPLIEACWGDTLEITVINKMKFNGTSIHWHGLRQLHNNPHDGVNGVTQCPIAPKDTYTYKIHLTQYGTSWLHSHFSVQYADGVQAPLTIHGPTSDNFDYAIKPLMISDWGHNSAFNAIFSQTLLNNTLVMNGTGDIRKFTGNATANSTKVPDPTIVRFNQPKNPFTGRARYLLRIINSAFESGLVFSIDNHMLQVVEIDFVPIVSNSTYNHTAPSILVGIGQRVHVIVEAIDACVPDQNGRVPLGCNFWVRTLLATGCASDINTPPGGANYSEVGILRYNLSDHSDPTTKQWPGLYLGCNETYANMTPTVPWYIKPPSNNQLNPNGQDFNFTVVGGRQAPYALAGFAFVDNQLKMSHNFQTNYNNPTFLNLGNDPELFPESWMVIPEDYKSNDYVYLIINDNGHPIHLHGHDFAIIKRNFTVNYDPSMPLSCNAKDPLYKLDCDNPPRRDVVLLPGWRNFTSGANGGWTAIAFKTDNPGAWLMHCHIAFHASSGLAIQIMERQTSAYNTWPIGSPASIAAQRTCKKWNDYSYDCRKHWPGWNKTTQTYPACDDALMLENDSGI